MNTTPLEVSIDLDTRLARAVGRPGRDRMANARVTEAERRELQEAAKAAGKSLSEWARDVLLREARGSRTDVLLTEVVAMRMMLNTLLRPLSCGEIITAEQFTAHMANIRSTKQKVTQDILQQYASSSAKEQ